MSDEIRKQSRVYTASAENNAELSALVGEYSTTCAAGNLNTRLEYAWELRRAEMTDEHIDAENSKARNIARIARCAP